MLRNSRLSFLVFTAVLVFASVPVLGAQLLEDVQFGLNENQEGVLTWRVQDPSISQVTFYLDGEVVHTTEEIPALTGQHRHVLPNIEPGRTYNYEITLTYWVGDNVDIIEGSFTTPAAQAPETVWAVRSGQDVLVIWDASFGAASYAVLRGTAADGDFEEIAIVDEASYVDVSTDGTYYYAVQAISPAGDRSEIAGPADGSNEILQGGLGLAFPDLSGNGNHGYIGGTPRWIAIETENGVERGVAFDNTTNQYIHTLTTGHLDGATNVVMVMDVYFDAATWTGNWGIIGGPHSGSGSTTQRNVQFTWTRRDPNGIDFRMNAGTDSGERRISSVINAGEYDGTWVTLRAEYDNGQFTFYANDSLKAQGNEGRFLNTLDLPFYLSTQSSNYNVGERVFNGQVKYVQLKVDDEVVLEWDFSTLIIP